MAKQCKVYFRECEECGKLFTSRSSNKCFCCSECMELARRKKQIARKVFRIQRQKPKYRNFSPRFAVVGDCLIVEKHNSRCPEYLKGECDQCFDFCVDHNWVGWIRLRKVKKEEKVAYQTEVSKLEKAV